MNTDRALGTRLSSEVTRKIGMSKLPDDYVFIRIERFSWPIFGCIYMQKVLHLEVFGDANDYVGKGLVGRKNYCSPSKLLQLLQTKDNVIIGNTVLYGATKGYLFACRTLLEIDFV